jgi:hypothetical protein
MTKQELTNKLINLPFNELSPELFWLAEYPFYTPAEQGEILTMRYFNGNMFAILNTMWEAILALRIVIDSNNESSQKDEANQKLTDLQNIFTEINTILTYFPKA